MTIITNFSTIIAITITIIMLTTTSRFVTTSIILTTTIIGSTIVIIVVRGGTQKGNGRWIKEEKVWGSLKRGFGNSLVGDVWWACEKKAGGGKNI